VPAAIQKTAVMFSCVYIKKMSESVTPVSAA
jgi:hypothetical protein